GGAGGQVEAVRQADRVAGRGHEREAAAALAVRRDEPAAEGAAGTVDQPHLHRWRVGELHVLVAAPGPIVAGRPGARRLGYRRRYRQHVGLVRVVLDGQVERNASSAVGRRLALELADE